MVRLLLKACLWQLSNSCFHSSIAWCQTPAKTRTTDGRAAREEKEEKCRGLERVWTYWGIPVEWTSCALSCVKTQGKNWDDWDTTLAFSKGKKEMRYCQTTSLLQVNHAQTPAQPLSYTRGQKPWNCITTYSWCIYQRRIERVKEQAQAKESERVGGSITVGTATSRSNTVGDPYPSVSPLCFPTLH